MPNHPNSADQLTITSTLDTLVSSQLPLSIGLRSLSEEAPSARLRRLFFNISQSLESGVSLERAIGDQSSQVPLYLSSIFESSQRQGTLDNVLKQLVEFLQTRLELRRQFLWSVLHSFVVVLIAFFVGALLNFAIIPQFRGVISGFGIKLPATTAFLFMISDLTPPFWGLVVLIVAVIIAIKWISQFPAPRRAFYYIPFYGPMIKSRGLSEFSKLLALLIRNRIPLPEAMRLTAQTVSDANLSAGAMRLSDLLASGISLRDALVLVPHFDAEFRQSTILGAQDEELTQSLEISGRLHTTQAALRMKLLGLAVEPVLIVGIGLGVGFVVFALLVPLLALLQALS